MSRTLYRIAAAALLVVGTLGLAGHLAADHTDQESAKKPVLQKAITHPLAKALAGTWTTKMTGKVSGTGTATFKLGVADTVLVQDEDAEHRGPDGNVMKGVGHGMYRFSEDGKTVTGWWIDNQVPEVVRTTGTATDNGFDISGEAPGSGKFRIVLEAAGGGIVVKSFMGDSAEPFWTQTYTRAGSPATPPAVR